MHAFMFDDRYKLPETAQRLLEMNLKNRYLTLISNATRDSLSTRLNRNIDRGKLKLIQPCDIEGYRKIAHKFEKQFSNYSTNSSEFEKSCFLRWLAIDCYATKIQIKQCEYLIILDTDLWLTSEIEQVFLELKKQYTGIDIIAEWEEVQKNDLEWISPELTIMRRDVLKHFSSFLTHIYFNEDNKGKHARWFESLKMKGAQGGICDMRALGEFTRTEELNIINWRNVKGYILIHSFNTFLENRRRKIIPYFNICQNSAQSIRTKTICKNHATLAVHFQGSSKQYIQQIEEVYARPRLTWGNCVKANPMLKNSRYYSLAKKAAIMIKNIQTR